jgi:hypothetical protein
MTRSADGETTVERRRAYAYMRKHLLMFDSEVNRTKARLAYFADQADLELAAVFVEELETWPSAFERLVEAVILDKVEVVLLPNLWHFAVLGTPGEVKSHFEATSGARVVTVLDLMSYEPGEAMS